VARPCRILTGFPRERSRSRLTGARALFLYDEAAPRHRRTLPVSMPLVRVMILALLSVALCAPLAAQPQPRIVSLMPALTEDLFAIGAGPQVVAVSEYTDYPPAAAALPAVASVTSVDAERIFRLHPSLVVGIASEAPLLADLRRLGVRIVLVDDDSYEDIFRTLAVLGRLSGHAREARVLAASLRARTAALERSVPRGAPPRVFVVLGAEPIFTVGDRSYIGRLIELAGGRNAAGLREAYGRYSAEALLAAQPDVIVTDPQSGLSPLLNRAPWNALRAVRAGRVAVIPDADLLQRPGPRYNAGLAWLIAELHPHAAQR
jgi:ABC-type Fe3+-hydroxamate transport system substrate-binding protein